MTRKSSHFIRRRPVVAIFCLLLAACLTVGVIHAFGVRVPLWVNAALNIAIGLAWVSIPFVLFFNRRK